MPKRKRAESEDAPKPLHTYLILAVVVVAVIGGTYFSRDSITAFVTGGSQGTVSVSDTPSQTNQVIQQPVCKPGCGSGCWLSVEGQPGTTYIGSAGRIGVLDCNENCFSVAGTLNQMRCCRNADCPTDRPVCTSGGICSV